MKRLLYYLTVAAAFVVVWLIGAFICAGLNTGGTFPMLLIAVASFGAARLTASLVKDKFVTPTDKSESN